MLPIPVQTTYQELLQRFAAQPFVSIEGSIISTVKAGRPYWIAKRRLGDRTEEQSLGFEDSDLLERIQQAREEQEKHKEWSQKNASLVAMLKSAGCLAPDISTGKTLNALSKIGYFRSGGIIAGTNAFRLYPLLLGMEAPVSNMSITGDVDMVAPGHLVLAGPREALSEKLQRAGLKIDFRHHAEPEVPPKMIVDDQIEIEIISPVARGGEPFHIHTGLQEKVTALRFIEYLLKDPIRQIALYRSGVEVIIPSPERYAIHKLIVAQLRTGEFRLKREKDFAQSLWLFRNLKEQRGYETISAYQDAMNRGPSWRDHIQASLEERPDVQKALSEVLEDN